MSGKTKGQDQKAQAGGGKSAAATTPGGKSGAAVKFSPMDAIRDTVVQLLQDSKCAL